MPRGAPDILIVERDSREEALALIVFGENNMGECVRVARAVDEADAILFADRPTFTPQLVVIGVKPESDVELDLARRIRRDPRTRDSVLVLIVTDDAEKDRAETAVGGSSLIVRPLEFEKLLDAAGSFSLWWRAPSRSGSAR